STRLRGFLRRGVVLSALSMVVLAGPADAQDRFLSMGTSSGGSSWYPLGGAMASVINKHVPSLTVNAEVTGGNVDNVKLLGNRQIELGLITSDQAYLAFAGAGPYEGKKITSFRGLLGGGQIVWQPYTLKRYGV